MPIWTIAKKELRLLIRDPRAAIVLLAMPFLFILVLGLSLGEGFGQKPDDRLRVSIVDLDQGFVAPATTIKEAMGFFAWTPSLPETGGAVDVHQLAGLALASASRAARFPQETWAKVVQRDMTDSNIRVEIVSTEAEAEALIKQSKRSAILVFGPDFSKRVHECSFLATPEPPPGLAAEFNPIYRNPFYRDGVMLKELDARLLVDNTQVAAASIIEQVAQVSLLRVILPWMIGRAFEKLGEPSFMSLLAEEVPGGKLLPASVKTALGSGVQGALKKLFPKYNLTEKTWAGLTKSQPRTDGGAETTVYVSEGLGLPHRGAIRYQILVPSYTVMFAFFLVLTVGWLFVSERRQGTIKRLRAAPLHNSQIVLGKLLPVYLISVGQGLFLLGGKARLRHALGAGNLGDRQADSLADAGGVEHIPGGHGARAADRQPGTHGDSGGDLRHSLGPRSGGDKWLLDAARLDAANHEGRQPGNTPCLGAGGVSAVADQSLSGLASRRTCLPGPCRIWSGISRAGVGDAEA